MKAIYKLFGLMAIAGLFASCNEDPEYYQPMGQNQPDEMHISVDNDNVLLLKENEKLSAVTFSWKKVTSSLSPDGPVTYAIRLCNADNSTEVTSFYQVGTETSKTFTVYELNSIIGRWVEAGSQCNLVAEVVAKMTNNSHFVMPMISSCQLSAKGYERFPATLYMHVLDDMTNEELQIIPMTQVSRGSGLYSKQISMTACHYYFSTVGAAVEGEEAEEGPTYVADATRTLDKGVAIKLNMETVTEDDYLEYTGAGTTTIFVDLNDPEEGQPGLDVRFVNTLPLPDGATTLYIVGDACQIGWNAGVSEAAFANPDSRNPWVYTWTGSFEYKDGQENSFKILTSNSFDTNVFFAPEAWADPMKNHTLKPYGNQGAIGDLKWKIAEGTTGLYTITLSLDQDDMWIKMEAAETSED